MNMPRWNNRAAFYIKIGFFSSQFKRGIIKIYAFMLILLMGLHLGKAAKAPFQDAANDQKRHKW